MGKKTAQPETEPDFKNETSVEPAVEAALDTKTAEVTPASLTITQLAEKVAAAEVTYARDRTLLCDNCKGRLERAHAEDERNRNAVYPEGVTP